TSPSPTTRPSRTRRPGSRSRFATYAPTRAPVGSSRCAATCRQCPDTAQTRRRSMSTSTRRDALSDSSEILADIVEEGRRVLAAAARERVPLRLLGGVAVRLRSTGLPPALQREYKDLDFATTRKGSGAAAQLLRRLGYDPHTAFNTMNSKERLLFFDDAHGRQVDVFVGSFRMCHEIPLERRLGAQEGTVPL